VNAEFACTEWRAHRLCAIVANLFSKQDIFVFFIVINLVRRFAGRVKGEKLLAPRDGTTEIHRRKKSTSLTGFPIIYTIGRSTCL
jgi:hypothetical protein